MNYYISGTDLEILMAVCGVFGIIIGAGMVLTFLPRGKR